MRFPRRKLYRAFPDLDRFSESQCEMLVRRIQQARSYGATMIIGVSLTSMVIFGLGVALWLRHQGAWQAFEKDLLDLYGRTAADVLGPGLAFAPMLAAAGLAGLYARDVLFQVLVRRAIRSRISRARCTGCGTSLLGLPAPGNVVRCPECSRVMGLRELGIESPAEMLSPPADFKPVDAT
jgi:hypothetical protein